MGKRCRDYRARDRLLAVSAACRVDRSGRPSKDQDVGVNVRSIGPHDGPQLFVHTDGSKEGCVLPDWLEYGTVQVRPKVHLSGRTVSQRETHSEALQRFDAADPDHTVTLLQPWNRVQVRRSTQGRNGRPRARSQRRCRRPGLSTASPHRDRNVVTNSCACAGSAASGASARATVRARW